MKETQTTKPTRGGLWLLICVLLCIDALIIGGLFRPGEWYDSLNLAPWNPPKWAFPVAWMILYVLIAISGWLIFKSQQAIPIAVWVIQLALNASWSWVFFELHQVLLGLVIISALIIMVGYLIDSSRHNVESKLAAYLLTPYFLWLCLAWSLNCYILLNN